MSKRRLGSMLLALGAVIAAVAVPTGIAHAEDPVAFGSSPVVDQAGVLGDQLASVEQSLADAGERSGRQLYVAYVDEFTNPSSAVEWAADTAVGANMGAEDYLLAVAVDGRAYYLSADQNASLSDAELDRISSEIIEPRLRDGDWAGAATAAADAIAGGSGAGVGGWGWLIALLLVAAVVVVIVLVVRARRRRGAASAGPAGPPPPSLDELRRTAGGALVQIDDALKTSEEELGFAVASYGDEATAPFREALTAAKGKVREAFAIQQQLDDEVPDTDEQRREWYSMIIRVTGEADALLDAQAERFDALRELERTAPEALTRLRQTAAVVETNAAPAAARLASLQAQYAPSALAAIADNPAQARARLDFARESMAEADAALARGEQGPAAVEIRAAEEAVDQAKLLAAAVERLAAELAAADAAIAAGAADLEQDVQTARAMPGGELAALAEQTAAEAAALRGALATTPRDPLALQARLAQANGASTRRSPGRAMPPNAPSAPRPSCSAPSPPLRRRRRRRRTTSSRAAARSAPRPAPGSPRPAGSSRRPARRRPATPSRRSPPRSRPSASPTRRSRSPAPTSAASVAAGTARATAAVRPRPVAAPAAISSARCSAASSSTTCSAAGAAVGDRAAAGAAAPAPPGASADSAAAAPGAVPPAASAAQARDPAAGAEADSDPHRPPQTRRHRPARRPEGCRRHPLTRHRKGTAMVKQSIFGRISQLVRANINALLDEAEDPQKMLDQMVRDYTNSIADAEAAIAETIGNLRLLEDDHREDVDAAKEWGDKALAASRKADELRAAGDAAGADKFDNLAKVALSRQISSENEAKAAEPQIAAQTEVVDKLKAGLNGMKQKLVELQNKRNELVARAKTAQAQRQVQDAVKSIDILDPTSDLGRFEQKIRREEALVRGQAEIAASSLDAQFNELDDLGELTEVDARLAALKAGGSQGAIGG